MEEHYKKEILSWVFTATVPIIETVGSNPTHRASQKRDGYSPDCSRLWSFVQWQGDCLISSLRRIDFRARCAMSLRRREASAVRARLNNPYQLLGRQLC